MTALPIELVRERLIAVTGYQPPNGRGDWRCPVHDDQNPSLSLAEGDDGRALLTCQTGCDYHAVVEALGLKPSNLFPATNGSSSRRQIDRTHSYVDENDEPLFEVVRFTPKGFAQRRPDGNGGWVWKVAGVRRVLYRLPEVIAGVAAGRTIWITEGEKDADTLAGAGEIATTNPGGAGKWSKVRDAPKVLAGADVVIVADADELGRAHAAQVAEALTAAVKSVRIVEAKVGKDAADHLAAGLGTDDFVDAPQAADNGPPVALSLAPGRDDAAERGWPVIDDAAFHGLAGEIVRTIEPHSEADPVALLVDLLVSFGSAVGPTPHAIVEGTQHGARLFAVLVGETARARKGTSRAQVRRVLDVADSEWSDRRVMGGLASGEGLIAAVADPVDDGKGNLVGGAADKRLLVVEPEFARVLGVAGREGNTLSPIIRESWDSGRLRVMTRREPLVATGAHVSILAHVTVEELRRRLTDTEAANGFANRFLFVCVRRSKLLPSGGTLSDTDIGRLGRLCRKAIEGARRVATVRRTAPAEELWAVLYAQMAADDRGGLASAITARAEAQVLRLSVTYALLDGSAVIDVTHLAAAWALWCYCEASAVYVFGDATGDEVADRLLDALRGAHPHGLDGTEQRDLFSRNVGGRRLEDARLTLERRGLAATVTEDTGGRPKRVTYLVSSNGTTKTTEVPFSSRNDSP